MEPDELKQSQPVPAASTNASPADGGGACWKRIGFWRAVAGMGIAVALGCAVIAAEFASELPYRSAVYRRRVAQLNAQVYKMRREIASAREQLDSIRAELDRRERLNRILSAGDSRLLRLQPLKPGGQASGVVAISRSSQAAMLDAVGLPPAPGDKIYELWWIVVHRDPIKAATFRTAARGDTLVAAELPPQGDRLLAAIVTLDPANGADKPTDTVELKGTA